VDGRRGALPYDTFFFEKLLFTNAWRKELVTVAFTYLYCRPKLPSIIAYLSIFPSNENLIVK